MTYLEAVIKTRKMLQDGSADSYACDGHSWVLIRLNGNCEFLYDGESTIL